MTLFSRILLEEEIDRLMEKYGWSIALGDQDYITNLGFEVGMVNVVHYDTKTSLGF